MSKQDYTIRLQEGAQPYALATARKVPYQLYDKVRIELQRMMQLGVIKEVTEPTSWVSPMVIVPKKDGSVRICVDFTKLNQSVQREQFQLPLAEEIFANLHGAKYFTTLDAASGFWQIPLTESCSPLTTFITPFGRFRFTRLPFGISSGPEVFHRSMRQVLERIEGADCFRDDILVWGATKEEHDARLHKVLEKLRVSNVKLQPSKSVFRRKEVTYYGHVISESGVKPDERKVKAIVEMKPPNNREELRRLMGMIAYVAKFLPRHSHVSAPLRELLRDDVVWSWTPAQDEAFQKLKEMVATAPVLAFYSQTAPSIVAADASSYGLGAVMYQVQEDGRRAPIAYASRTLTDAERNYSQIEKEALAMTWACSSKFHCYLYGSEKPFVVETDHQPLKTIMNVQQLDECPPRLMRMKLRMMQYCFRVEYVPGKKLVVPDTLSRSPIPLSPNALPDYSDRVVAEIVEEHVSAVSSLWPASDRQLQRIRDETSKDPQLAPLLQILQSQWPKTKAALDVRVQGFWDNRHLFSQVDGLILRGNQIVIPKTMRPEMLQRAHEGHFGIARTRARIREILWWPDMNNQLTQMLAGCAVCAQCQAKQRKEPLKSTPLPGRPWEKLAVDLFGWNGAHYALVVDYYSRYPELRKLSSTRAANVITAMKEIFACHGVPCEVLSDNGPQFSCGEFAEFAKQYGFYHSTSSPRYPQGNGLVERCVRSVKDMLKKAQLSGGDFHLALLSYRTTPHATTSWSPAQLLMSRQLRTTLPTSSSCLKPIVVPRTVVDADDQCKKEKQARYYNARHGARELPKLYPGNQVLVWDIDHHDWRIPATVIKVMNARSFLVRLSGGSTLRRNRHQLQLRPLNDDISESRRLSRSIKPSWVARGRTGSNSSSFTSMLLITKRPRIERKCRCFFMLLAPMGSSYTITSLFRQRPLMRRETSLGRHLLRS
jgi:transposase InsO family protein